MPNGSPPARKRPTPSAAPSADRPRRPAPEIGGSKLVCSAGPSRGAEFELTDGELVIGRANDNAISIPDTSVSRKHAVLRKMQGGWAAADLGSGNGTLINGDVIAEETALCNGDVLT